MDANNIDVNELFGDDDLGDAPFEVPANVELLPNQTLLPAGLVQHIEDLHRCGSCQRVAWSKQGNIATLNPDLRHVDITCLRFSKKDNSWGLSKPQPLFQDDYEFDISHVQWSPTGADLAVADLAGRVGIFSISPVAVNMLFEVRPASLEDPDELGQTVALFWLNQKQGDRERTAVLYASKDESRWTHINARRKPHGPYFPRGVAVINRKGTLRLIFQRPDQRFADASTQLHTFESPDEYLTHAAFAPTLENRLLITTHTNDQKLSVYMVNLVWHDIRQDPSAEFLPTFEVEVVKPDLPNPSSYQSSGSIFQEETYNPDIWGLTHLEIIPTSDIEKTPPLPPTIVAIYTSINNSVDVTSPGYLSSSVVRRWTVQAVEQKLHPRFDDVAVKSSGGSSPQPKMDVAKMEPDIPFDQIITSFQQVDGGQLLVVTTQDGASSFWKPDMTQAFLENQDNEVTSMPQSGFVFQLNPYPLQLAFSPNACRCVSLDLEGNPQLSGMQFHQTPAPVAIEAADPTLDAALASVVVAFARASYSSANTDDLLICILENFRADQIQLLLLHMYRSLFRNTEMVGGDVSNSELSQLQTKGMVSKVLSFHAALGFVQPLVSVNSSLVQPASLSTTHRNTVARFAWLTLHVRNTAILFLFLMSVAKGQQASSTAYHRDFIDLLCTHARWSLDLFKWMLDAIQEVVYREENPGFSLIQKGDLKEANDEEQEKLTLVTLLLTGVWSKYFLRFTVKLLAMTVSVPLGGVAGPFARIAQVVDRYSRGQGLSMTGIEKLLDFTTPHEGPVVGIEARARREAEMMATGRVPEAYEATVRRFREKILPEIRKSGEMERLKLFECAAGWGWAGLEDEGDREGSGGVVDVHKKIVLKGIEERGENVRVCVRCAGLSEDLGLSKDWPRALLPHMSRQMNRCVCEGGWVIEECGGK